LLPGTNSFTIDGGTAVTGTSPGIFFDILVSTLSAGAHIVITNTATTCTATATATVAQPTA
jgi:hypothetical protein